MPEIKTLKIWRRRNEVVLFITNDSPYTGDYGVDKQGNLYVYHTDDKWLGVKEATMFDVM